MQTAEAWRSGRPIYSRLPGVNGQYQDELGGTIAEWLTAHSDLTLVQTKTKILDLPRQLNPNTCDESFLDFLAILNGFTGEYWDTKWTTTQKRSILTEANWIWENKGSKMVLEYLFNVFAIESTIWEAAGFYAGVTLLPATIGEPDFRYMVTLPLKYLRNSPEFKLAEKLNNLFGPVVCESRACYVKFYAGFSVAGDPCFD